MDDFILRPINGIILAEEEIVYTKISSSNSKLNKTDFSKARILISYRQHIFHNFAFDLDKPIILPSESLNTHSQGQTQFMSI